MGLALRRAHRRAGRSLPRLRGAPGRHGPDGAPAARARGGPAGHERRRARRRVALRRQRDRRAPRGRGSRGDLAIHPPPRAVEPRGVPAQAPCTSRGSGTRSISGRASLRRGCSRSIASSGPTTSAGACSRSPTSPLRTARRAPPPRPPTPSRRSRRASSAHRSPAPAHRTPHEGPARPRSKPAARLRLHGARRGDPPAPGRDRRGARRAHRGPPGRGRGGRDHRRRRPPPHPRARLAPEARKAPRAARGRGDGRAGPPRSLEALHREEPFDRIHAHSPVLCGLPAHAAARRLGVPCVYEVRAFWEDAAADQGKGGPGSRALRRRPRPGDGTSSAAPTPSSRSARASAATSSIAVSRRLASSSSRTAWTPRASPRLPRDEALAESLGLRGKLVVAYLGTLFRFEGVALLLHALRRLVDARAEVRGLVVPAAWRGRGRDPRPPRRPRPRRPRRARRPRPSRRGRPLLRARRRPLLPAPAPPHHGADDALETPGGDEHGQGRGRLGRRRPARAGGRRRHGLPLPRGRRRAPRGRADDGRGRRRSAPPRGRAARARMVEGRDWRKVTARYAEVYAAASSAAQRGRPSPRAAG